MYVLLHMHLWLNGPYNATPNGAMHLLASRWRRQMKGVKQLTEAPVSRYSSHIVLITVLLSMQDSLE